MDFPLRNGDMSVNGLRLHYVEAGTADGPAVVFVHGIGGGVEDWWANLGYFSERGYRVLAPSFPGHGPSDLPRADWDPLDSGKMLLSMMDVWGVQEALLVGHSAGCIAVMQAALEAPERVKSLVLTAPGGLGRKLGWSLRVLSVPMVGELMWHPRALSGSRARKAIFADETLVNNEILDQWIARSRDSRQRRAFFRLVRQGIDIRGLKARYNMLPRTHDISCPTLIIWGKEDQVIPPPKSEAALLNDFPTARFVSPSPCGHWPQVEQPDTFNRETDNHLKSSLADGQALGNGSRDFARHGLRSE